MRNLMGNIRYALRQFRLSPVFTAAAVATLALGIGGTTAIFTLIHSTMLKSLPVADPASLYRVGDGTDCCVEGGPQDRWGMVSTDLYERVKAATPEFEQITAFQAGGERFAIRREKTETAARVVIGEYVSGSYFQTLGVGAYGGRVFTPEDDTPAAAPVAVMSYHTWQSTYGGDPSVVGSTFIVDSHPFTVIGISPPGFFGETLGADPPELWVPIQKQVLIMGRDAITNQKIESWLRVIGRLKPGATTDGMSARLTTLLRNWMRNDADYPPNWLHNDIDRILSRQYINVVPAGAGVAEMKEEYGRSLMILLTVCGLVLLIACANVANLLLARAAARRSQTAVRLAIGANRSQVIAQALTESVLLAVLGGLAGLLVAFGAARLLLSLAFASAQFLPISTTPSLPVLGASFLLALITGVIFGAVPAYFATRTDPADALRGAGRSTAEQGAFTRKALVVVQATLCVVLVAGATMMARSLSNVEHQDFGYQVPGRIEVTMQEPPADYTPAHLDSLNRQLFERMNQLPGVHEAGLSMYNPLTNNWGELILIDGKPEPKFGENAGASWTRITPNYLNVLGQTLVRGRGFTDGDNRDTDDVALVNEDFVKRFLPNEDPLDKRFGFDVPANARMFRIVGVVRNAKWQGWRLARTDKQPAPMVYFPLAQWARYPDKLMAQIDNRGHFVTGILLHTDMSPSALEPVLTRALGEVDPNLSIVRIRTLREQIQVRLQRERAVAWLAALFGVVALLLAAVGLYGVTAYSVAQRTNEIGIRMALGADRNKVVRLVLRSAFARVAIGLGLGVPLAIGAARLISNQLYGVRIWDPPALGTAVITLVVCAFCAAIIPAGRAAAIDPMSALRAE
jgi:predicted permease